MSDSDVVPRDEFFDSLLGDFLDESGQLLDRLNENLLQLDEWVRSLDETHSERCDDELMNDMFRSAHSLKGLSGMLGLTDINSLTHKVENVFDAARKDELIISGDIVELMFQAVDRLVGHVDLLKDPEAESVDSESVVQGIAQVLEAAGVAREQTSQEDAEKALADLVEEAATTASQPESGSEDTTPTAEDEPSPPEPSDEPVVDYFQGLEDEADSQSKYLSIFIDETELSLDQLTETLLALEGGGNRAALDTLLVTSHRIKGSAASVGLNRPAKLAHLMEDLLQNLVGTGRVLSPEMTDAMLRCTDALRQYVEELKRGGCESDQFNEMAHELLESQVAELPKPDALQPDASGSGANQTSTSSPTTTDSAAAESSVTMTAEVTPELRKQVEATAADYDKTFAGAVVFDPLLPLVGLKARLIYEKLSNLGDVCFFDPPAESLDELEHLDGVRFGVLTEESQAAIAGCLRIAGVRQSVIEPLAPKKAEPVPPKPTSQPRAAGSQAAGPQAKAKQSAPAAPAKTRPADTSTKPTETLRVDIERLDQLMNLAGELVINKARFSQIGDKLKDTLASRHSSQRTLNIMGTMLEKMANGQMSDGSNNLQAELDDLRSHARKVQSDLEGVARDIQVLSQVRIAVNDLGETIHQLDRVTDGIQQSVMDTRMLPIGPLFARFKRVIRDITRANGKNIKLVIKGEKTELDKRMIDELGDPLIHMVRNSADHGIELPEDRIAAGKPPEGTVTLDAFHRGNSIVIQVTDDGKGLDPEKIRAKALEKNLYSEAELDAMSRHQMFQVIWEPGLSTAEKVTQISGRGMGMDIVKSKIEDLNGAVDLDSEPGQSTTLTIKLPLTLAILPSLMVEIDGDIIAMPLESVVEIVTIGQDDVSTVHGQYTARVRGRVISTVKLSEVFNFHGGSTQAKEVDPEEATLVIVGDEGRELGLIVDCVLGEEDIVIKSMAENYRNVAGIAGASILGDGRVSLILDLAALIDMASHKNQTVAVS